MMACEMSSSGMMRSAASSRIASFGMPNTMQIDYFRAYSGTIDP